MKVTTGLTLLALCLAGSNSFAGAIVNGDFSSCDYSGWQQDTDGFGDVSTGNDFAIVNNAGDCSAAINADYFDPAGDFTGTPLTEAFFANTLFQDLDLSGDIDSTFTLEIDFAVNSEINSNDQGFVADYFLIGLSDGSGDYFDQTGGLGFLTMPTDIDGAFSQVLSFELDNSFMNQIGWSLDFQLNIGVDDQEFSDAFGSTFRLNSVALTENPSQVMVSEPAALGMLSLGLVGLYMRKKRS